MPCDPSLLFPRHGITVSQPSLRLHSPLLLCCRSGHKILYSPICLDAGNPYMEARLKKNSILSFTPVPPQREADKMVMLPRSGASILQFPERPEDGT